MPNEPLSHKITRIIIILILLGVFAALTVLHVLRLSYPAVVTREGYAWEGRGTDTYSLRLPELNAEPLTNHTRFTTFECASGNSTDISPYTVRNHSVPFMQEDLAASWQKYQELKAKSPNASTDELLAQGSLDDDYRFFSYRRGLRAMFDNSPEFQEELKKQRWNRYSVYRDHWDPSSPQLRQVVRQGMTCRIGGFQEISVENATVTTPTVVREVGGNGTSTPVGSVGTYESRLLSDTKIPFVTNQQLVLTYTPVQECWEHWYCPFCPTSSYCHVTYELASKDLLPVGDGVLLPTTFQSASQAAGNYAYVTTRLDIFDQDYYGPPLMAQRTHMYVHDYLDLVTALFAAICFLTLVYKLLMGDFKVNPFGWVQRFVLFSSRKAYVDKIKEEAGEQQLEKLLFALYLDGSRVQPDPNSRGIVGRVLDRIRTRNADNSAQV